MYTREQVIAMYEKAKERGFPVDTMNWNTFLNYLRNVAPELLNINPIYLFASSAVEANVANAAREVTLLFDGEKLYWQERDFSTSWVAYSGRNHSSKDYSIEAQKNVGSGPIPEGQYMAPRTRYQERPEDTWSDIKHYLGRGAWPGGAIAWGNQRVWLEPVAGTETHGRSGFSIHGGTNPGSAGCIDLVDSMDNFAARFLKYGKDIPLRVDYSKFKKPIS
jgi:hypothetical protein